MNHTAPVWSRGLAGPSLARRLLAGVGSTALMLVVAALSFATLSTFRAADHLVEHTPSVIATLRDVEKGPLHADAEQRGSFLTAARRHEHIFRIFQTLASRDEVEGTGMGPAIVKKLVEDRGGRVWVESEPGKGAKFCFTWATS